VPHVFATTVYQQFTDSSGIVEVGANTSTHALLASFQVQSPINVNDAEIQLVWWNHAQDNLGTPYSGCQANLASILVATSSVWYDQISNNSFNNLRLNGSSNPNCVQYSEDELFTFAIATTSSPGSLLTVYQPGVTYYVWVEFALDDADSFIQIASNLSSNFFYGYLTAGGLHSGTDIPILPGLPGYTDVGISTTSQQVYCNSNFSTSTGLLDSLGKSISTGICNVGVFLFVPSQNALSSFATLSSTTQTKIPFSYYYNVKSILQTASSTSGNFTSIHLNLGGATGVASTTPFAGILNQDFQLLSTSTISTYISPSTYNLLMDLARYAIWIAVMFHVYRRIVPKHANV